MAAINYLAELPRSTELVIVGGGVVGAATAFHAARAGLHPLLLERRPHLCTLTTPAAAGAFRLQFDTRDDLELMRESVELFLHFEEITGQSVYRSGVRQQGYLWLTTSEDGVVRQREAVARQHSWGQSDIELLTGEEVRYRFPFIGPNVRQARFRAGDGFLDQKQVSLGLVAASRADVLTNCAVTGFDIRDRKLSGVRTTQGTVATGQAVIAAGPFSGVVAEMAGVSLPVETVKRQKVVLPQVPEVPERTGVPLSRAHISSLPIPPRRHHLRPKMSCRSTVSPFTCSIPPALCRWHGSRRSGSGCGSTVAPTG